MKEYLELEGRNRVRADKRGKIGVGRSYSNIFNGLFSEILRGSNSSKGMGFIDIKHRQEPY